MGGQGLGAAANVHSTGQSFLVTRSFTAEQVGLALTNPCGATGSFVYELYLADGNGAPTGPLLASSANRSATALPIGEPTTAPPHAASGRAGITEPAAPATYVPPNRVHPHLDHHGQADGTGAGHGVPNDRRRLPPLLAWVRPKSRPIRPG